MESIVYITSANAEQTDWENFHEFLRDYTDIFGKNVNSSEDYTSKKLKY